MLLHEGIQQGRSALYDNLNVVDRQSSLTACSHGRPLTPELDKISDGEYVAVSLGYG